MMLHKFISKEPLPTKKLKILYAAGPGDVIGTYNHWKKGEDDPSQVSVTYSGQFYDLCRELDAQAYVISYNSNKKIITDAQFIIEHRPRLFPNSSGIKYHLCHLLYGLTIILSALRFQANVIVLSGDTSHLFIFSILDFLGIKVIPSLHCVLWPKFLPRTKFQNFILKINSYFFGYFCCGILSASDDINKQLIELTNEKRNDIRLFLPSYRHEQFAGFTKPNLQNKPFKVLFVGRIETNKGVFLLLDIAKRFASEEIYEISFDLCGSGSALDSLKSAAKEAQVDSFFICHGHYNKLQMANMYSESHIVIVPTTTDFIEGFNQVVVEGVLSGRPVITSNVCPSVNYVQEAVVQVKPDDTKAYGDAILDLYKNHDFYLQKQKACYKFQQQFYDLSNSWKAKLKETILAE